jgi:hypothetical protein
LLLPKLHEIHIDIRLYEWRATPQLISFLSLCSLEVLSFKTANHHPCDDDMIQILRACSSLVQLELRGRGNQCMTKSFLAQFAYHRGTRNSEVQLVPKLRTLTVDYTPRHFNIFDFADSIQSRMMPSDEEVAGDTSIAGLRIVEIHYFKDGVETLDTTILSRLRQLKNKGLKISILQERKDLL